jgi:hypothetical protein
MTQKFKPTFLYVKTHNTTGLKYFGNTINPNVDKSNGSDSFEHGNTYGLGVPNFPSER